MDRVDERQFRPQQLLLSDASIIRRSACCSVDRASKHISKRRRNNDEDDYDEVGVKRGRGWDERNGDGMQSEQQQQQPLSLSMPFSCLACLRPSRSGKA